MYLEGFCSMKWRTCTHPSPGPSWGAHLPAHLHTFNFGTAKLNMHAHEDDADMAPCKDGRSPLLHPRCFRQRFFLQTPEIRCHQEIKLHCSLLKGVDISARVCVCMSVWASHRKIDRQKARVPGCWWVKVSQILGLLPPSLAPPSYCMEMRVQSSKLRRSGQARQ